MDALHRMIATSFAEFEEIKAQLIHLDAELNRLLAPPLVYVTVVRADSNPSGLGHRNRIQ
jgi:hypothetical protein